VWIRTRSSGSVRFDDTVLALGYRHVVGVSQLHRAAEFVHEDASLYDRKLGHDAVLLRCNVESRVAWSGRKVKMISHYIS